jgi:hypothetical protein
VSTETTQDGWPTHSAVSALVVFAALHAPLVKPVAHDPDGVPNEAKGTAVILLAVPGHASVCSVFSAASSTHGAAPLVSHERANGPAIEL